MARGGTSEESASSGTAKERGSNLARVMAASFSGGLSIFFEMWSESGGFIHRFI